MARPLLIFLVANAVQTLGAIVYQSLGVLGPIVVNDLALNAVEFGLVPSAMHAGSFTALAVSASLRDRAGVVRLLGIAALVCAADGAERYCRLPPDRGRGDELGNPPIPSIGQVKREGSKS